MKKIRTAQAMADNATSPTRLNGVEDDDRFWGSFSNRTDISFTMFEYSNYVRI